MSKRLLAQLRDAKLLRTQGYVNGKWTSAASGATFAVKNPANGETIAEVADFGAEDARRCIEPAHAAFQAWRATTAKERSDLLKRFFALIMSSQRDLAAIMTAEQGKPLAEAMGEIVYGASYVEWYAEEIRRAGGEVVPSPFAGRKIIVQREPVGVAAMITPWNFPHSMITRKLGPALAAGCATIVKPATETPLSALALCELAERAGLPPGLFNVVPTHYANTPAIGQLLCTHPLVRKLSFTGSTATGKLLAAQSAANLQRLSLELGGNAPFLVFADADVDAAVAGALASKFRNAGQTCVCTNRFYVHEGVHDEFVRRLQARMAETLVLGDGARAETTVGPLIGEKAVAKVQEHIDDAVAHGGRVLVGGKRRNGNFFEPTLVVGLSRSAKLAREETFGPLAGVIKFATEAEAVAWANDSSFGLAAYVYTRDLARGWRVSDALQCGMVGLNVGLISTEAAPFGGVKHSGYGREGGKWGLDEYTQYKYTAMGGL